MPLLAAAIGVGMVIVYLVIIDNQGNSPAWWFVALMLIASALAAYGSLGSRDHRLPTLALSAFLFVGLGFLSIFTIGLPIILAAVLAGVGASLAAGDA